MYDSTHVLWCLARRCGAIRLWIGALLSGVISISVGLASTSDPQVTVEILEAIPTERTWHFERPRATSTWTQDALALVAVPTKFTPKGLVADRTNPYMVVARSQLALPAGEYRLLLRAHGAARLTVDGKLIVETDFLQPNEASHEPVPKVVRVREPGLPPLPLAHQEAMTTLMTDGEKHEFMLEAIVGGKGLRAELGELVVAVGKLGQPLSLLGSRPAVPFTQDSWTQYARRLIAQSEARDEAARAVADAGERQYWEMRHEFARRHVAGEPIVPPPTLRANIPVWNDIDSYIGERLEQRGVDPAPLADDYSFLRRIHLDTVGVVPTPQEIRQFVDDQTVGRRQRAIDRLLEDPRWADNWVGYWQDVLAENPALVKPMLNNTGPFRWWIHQSFLDNKPMDRFVTELVLMEGSKYGGAPGGFSLATMNDVPMVSKAHVVAQAFLAVEMKCARCHDAPYHPFAQQQLFSLGAMLARSPLEVPKSSTVDLAGRTRIPAVKIALAPGASVQPAWPFPDLVVAPVPPEFLRETDDPREQLAAVLTSPQNDRFAQVIVNRLWKRYLGWGVVDPVDDWSSAEPSHPRLLEYLARELVSHDYDLKHVARLIFRSHTYQRAVRPAGLDDTDPANRLFASPRRRRMSAEQLVDSLFLVSGKSLQTELLCLDPEGRRPITQFLNLGTPRRAWEFTSLSNDRDRPSLSLPFAQNSVDLLVAFGWRESRQNPISLRDQTPNILQPMTLAHGVVGRRVATLSDDSALAEMCFQEQPLADFIEAVFMRILSRGPTERESSMFLALLEEGYDDRVVPAAEKIPAPSVPMTAVSWANHFDPEAVRIKLELAQLARAGDPPTKRLRPEWRERAEDMIWALLQSPEFLFIP